MNRVHIKTYGCQMNERDSEAVAAMLCARGYEIVPTEEEADIVLLNTCSVRDQAERKAAGMLRQIASRRRGRRYIAGVMGCMAQNRGRGLLDILPDLDLIVGTWKFHHVPGHLDRLVAEGAGAAAPRPAPVVDVGEEEGSQNMIRGHLPAAGRAGAYVSIMQGCDMSCAFCIVPKTRGTERSRPMEDIVAECAELAGQGVREVTLLGQIVTSYGRREYPHTGGVTPFVQLLEKVHAIPGIARIRYTSPHPKGFREDLVEAHRRLPKLCPCVHLPVQSGSNRILRAMNRPYTRERYLEIVDALRAAVPGMLITTDIIVGFPGETEEDFQETASLFGRVGYDMAYIFKYSVRSGTPAAEMPGQVSAAEKERRNQVLLGLLREESLRNNGRLLGTVQEVLVAGGGGRPGRVSGRTRGNRVVHFEGGEELAGRLVPVRIDRVTASALYGEITGPQDGAESGGKGGT